jgi:hypothetical protein
VLKSVKTIKAIILVLKKGLILQYTKTQTIMKASDLKKGSIVEIRLNLSPEQMNQPVQVAVERCTEKYLWFKNNHLQRMGRNTFDTFIQHFGYKIVSI